MAEHVHIHVSLLDMDERAGGAFSGMNVLVDLFANEATGIDGTKTLT